MKKTHCIRGHARTPDNLYGRSCATCGAVKERDGRAKRKAADPFGYYLAQLRRNATKRGLEFTITKADLMPLPVSCPVLGMRLDYSGIAGGPAPNAASVDRSDCRLGYVPGNVVVMSARANMLKNDASAEELQKVAYYVARL